jgi:hypothetical protein
MYGHLDFIITKNILTSALSYCDILSYQIILRFNI